MDKASNVVSLEYRVNKAFMGKYFIGHTPLISMDANTHAWAGLVNPKDSDVNLFLCTFTVSNYNDCPLQAMMWLSDAPRFGVESCDVAVSNQSIRPSPKPEGKIIYSADNKCAAPDGTSIFPRIVGPYSTEVGNYYGKIVVPPDHAVIITLDSLDQPRGVAGVAFGWWEDHKRYCR